jgi:hypothetical protein
MTEKNQEQESLPRDMISIVCPCCGELVPIELILNAGGLNGYFDIVGIAEGGYSERDNNKRWPVIALELKADETRYLEDRVSSLLKKYEDAKVKLVPD